ncbi:hypothetical protein TNIN_1381, partial [Trichonephila inaurata madagascariensis]
LKFSLLQYNGIDTFDERKLKFFFTYNPAYEAGTVRMAVTVSIHATLTITVLPEDMLD